MIGMEQGVRFYNAPDGASGSSLGGSSLGGSSESLITGHFFQYDSGSGASPTTLACLDSPRLVVFGGRDICAKSDAQRFCKMVAGEWGLESVPIFSAFYESGLFAEENWQTTLEDYYNPKLGSCGSENGASTRNHRGF
jgi:hypothetical protein